MYSKLFSIIVILVLIAYYAWVVWLELHPDYYMVAK